MLFRPFSTWELVECSLPWNPQHNWTIIIGIHVHDAEVFSFNA